MENQLRVYATDSEATLKERVAARLNSLPKYIFIKKNLQTDLPVDLTDDVVDVFNWIKRLASDPQMTYFQANKLIREVIHPNIKLDLIIPFIVYNTGLNQLADQDIGFALSMIPNLDLNNAITDYEAEEIVRNRDKERKKIENAISQNKKKVELYERDLRNVTEEVVFTEFEVAEREVKLQLNVSEPIIHTNLQLFDVLVATDDVPFISYNNYFKMVNDVLFVPNALDWVNEPSGGFLNVYVNTSETLNPSYTKVFLLVEDEKVYVQFTLASKDENADKRFNDRIKAIFSNVNFDFIESTIVSVSGQFFIPNNSYNKYILADMTLNNPLFASEFVISDTDGTVSNFVRLISKSNHKTSATLYNETRGAVSRELPKDLFPVGSSYIRIKLSNSKDYIADQKKVATFLSLYNAGKDEIIEEYKTYIPNFTVVYTEKQKQKKKPPTLIDIDPDMFLPNDYNRRCDNPPSIVTDESLITETVDKDGNKIYKLGDLQVIKYPSEKGYWFVCDQDKKNKYVSLMENHGKNYTKYKYIPCCRKYDQISLPGSELRQYYYNDEPPVRREEETTTLVKSNRHVPPGRFGVLPENSDFASFLQFLMPNKKLFRYGVARSPQSLIYCIETAVKANKRKLLSANIPNYFFNCCKQELHEKTDKEIRDLIFNPNNYVDPRFFYRVLEVYYNCTIFTFSRVGDTEEMAIPKFVNFYLHFKANKPVVIIYEHTGTHQTQYQYPQCEIVCFSDTADVTDINNFEFSFTDKSVVSKIKNLFNSMVLSVETNNFIDPVDIILPFKVESQYIDNYGKTRVLSVNVDGELVYLFTTPIPPLAIPTLAYDNITPCKLTPSKLASFLQTELKQLISGSDVVELSGQLGNVEFVINMASGFKPALSLVRAPLPNSAFNYPLLNESYLQTYNNNKRIARILGTLATLLFKMYYDEVNNANVSKFLETRVKIVPDHLYNIKDKKSFVSGSKKIILQSESMRPKIGFIIKQAININNNTTLLDASINDIQDLDLLTSFVYYGKEELIRYITRLKIQNKLYPSFQLQINDPYFVLYNSRVVLALNCDTLEEALSCSYNWSTKQILSKEGDGVVSRYNLYDREGRVQKVGGGDSNINVVEFEPKFVSINYV